MALSKALEAFLKSLPEETQKVLTPVCEANPALGEGWLRQEDYSRQSAEIANQKKELEGREAKAKEWQDWWKDSEPVYKRTQAENQRLREEAAALKGQQEALNERLKTALKEGDVDPEILKANVNTRIDEEFKVRGFVTQEKINAIIAEENSKLDTKIKAIAETILQQERKTFLEETLPATVHFNQSLLEIAQDYKDEFGTKLPRAELSKFMQDNKLADPQKAFEMWVGPKRTEKALKAAEERGRAEGKKEVLESRGMPGNGALPSPEMGHMEAAFRKSNGAQISTTREAASAAAAELIAEGKG